MSFIAIPEESTGSELENSPFWPAVDTGAARAAMRLNEMVTKERLEHALIEAMAYVNDQLQGFEAQQVAAGRDSLASVPCQSIAGRSVKVTRYFEAVYSWATAHLVDQYATLDQSNTSQNRAEDLLPKADSYRRDCYWAMQDIKNLPRATVELI